MSASPVISAEAAAVLEERYLRRDESGRVCEDAAAMFRRVARAAAGAGEAYGDPAAEWEDRFTARMEGLEFLPNSPALMNAGTPDGQLAACFVLPVTDDLDSIFGAMARMVRIHQTGGGTGFSFSALRPREDRVRSTGGISSGPLSFMELFDHVTAVIREGGRRRGANMAVLRVEHPEIEDFIAAKRVPGRLENFNLSVGAGDDFFESLDTGGEIVLRNPRTGAPVRTLEARRLWREIVEAAWACGEPGLLFVDEVNRANPTPALGRIEATNPCGEQPLLPYESCVLGSINLAAFASRGEVAWERLRAAARDGVVFLDNVIDATAHPFPEIAAATRRTRKIGLGVMGLADLLAALGVAYDSDAGVALGERIASAVVEESRAKSAELGAKRGSFPAFEQSIWPGRGWTSMRNAAVTCVAPTGTISVLANVASGIEPFFALAVVRRLLDGRRFTEVNPAVAVALEPLGGAREEALAAARECGSIRDVAGVPVELRRRFPIATEIAPAWHVRMQAAFQRHVDAAVSKTVNLPTNAGPEAVEEVFGLARRYRLKGITVYRYGSRPRQALSLVGEAGHGECRECAV